MFKSFSRREYLERFRSARTWAAFDEATNQQMRTVKDPCMPAQNSLKATLSWVLMSLKWAWFPFMAASLGLAMPLLRFGIPPMTITIKKEC